MTAKKKAESGDAPMAVLQRLLRVCRERGLDESILEPEYAAASGVKAVEGGRKKRVTVRVQGILSIWWGFDPHRIVRELDAAAPDEIHVLIDSPGGSVDDANTLYSSLRRRAVKDNVAVSTEVEGSAFSAASTILLAGDSRSGMEGVSQVMVHAPWTAALLVGTLSELDQQFRAVRNGMEAAHKQIAEVLSTRTPASADTIAEWMETDTYFTAAEAKAAGLLTETFADSTPEAVDPDALAADNERARALAHSILRRSMTAAKLSGDVADQQLGGFNAA